MIGTLNVDDPSLSTGVGTASYRQGMVYFLLGNYENAVTLWRDKSIAQVRTQRSLMAPAADPDAPQRRARRLDPDVPGAAREGRPAGRSGSSSWPWPRLEGGLPPDLAADHFQTALKLEPDLTVRPLIAYYLEKLGKPVPPRQPEARPGRRSPPTPADPTPEPPATPVRTPRERLRARQALTFAVPGLDRSRPPRPAARGSSPPGSLGSSGTLASSLARGTAGLTTPGRLRRSIAGRSWSVRDKAPSAAEAEGAGRSRRCSTYLDHLVGRLDDDRLDVLGPAGRARCCRRRTRPPRSRLP